jgi:hypothetical protein
MSLVGGLLALAGTACADDPTSPRPFLEADLLVPSFSNGAGIGGPVILMGLDSELTPLTDSHGPPEEHACHDPGPPDNVTNGGSGILVTPSATMSARR